MTEDRPRAEGRISAAPESDSPGHLVVIGSSAGGIEALSILVGSLPAEFPAPVVLAQHLDPTRPSFLASILERKSRLPVVMISGDTPLENGKVYVVPSNRHVVIRDGHVGLEDHYGTRPRPSVDLLLSSAAHVYGDRLIAVVLTGSGSDGASGAVEVKEAGGVVVIQNPETAAHPSMPLALPPTAVDHVADIGRIGGLLTDLLSGAALPGGIAVADDVLADILSRITRQASIDFRQYKPSTILRRIGRRMAINHVRTLEEYRDFLDHHPEELAGVVMSLLIKVTEFFRDPEAFEYMKDHVFPRLIEAGRERGRTLRLWSAGCATGEEAYTLAMLTSEALGPELPEWNIKIFATDVDGDAIQFARRGLYPLNTVGALPETLRERYLERADSGYRIHKSLRQTVIFGQQDLSRGVPFPRIDMVVCRNLLIYFKPELQQEVLDLFAYSLHQTRGYLFLGKAETARPSKSVFEMVNKKWKVYRCLSGPLPVPVRPSAAVPSVAPAPDGAEARASEEAGDAPAPDAPAELDLTSFRRLNELMMRHVPFGLALIDRSYRILSLNAAGRRLLGIRDSGVGQDFLHTARSLPYHEVRPSIDRMFREKATVTLHDVALEVAGGAVRSFVTLVISPLPSERTGGAIGLVCVMDNSELVETRGKLEALSTEQKRLHDELTTSNQRLIELNKELQDANEELQAGNEEMMLAQEELQATNEEFEATNEELQATNEELETNNEELQATNEELETTNEELQARTSELQDLTRVLTGERQRLTEMVERAPFSSMLLLGPELKIASMNEPLQALFGSRSVIGLTLEEAMARPEMEGLRSGARRALVEDRPWTSGRLALDLKPGNRTYVFSAIPSHGDGGRVDGVVLYAEDVTDVVRHEEQERLDRLKRMLDHADQVAMAVFEGPTSRLLYASRRYLQMIERVLGYSAAEAEGRGWRDLWFGSEEGLRAFEEVVASNRPQRFREVRVQRRSESSAWDVSLIPIADEGGPEVQHVVVSAVEITDSVLSREQLERLDRMKDEFLSLASHELRTPLAPLSAYVEVLSRLIEENPRDPHWETQLQTLVAGFRKQVRQMSRLTDDLLDMSRLQSGKFTLEMKPLVLRQVVDDAIERATMVATRPPIRLAWRVDAGTRVMGDDLRLGQLVHNLLVNAIRHASDSEWVDLRVDPGPVDGPKLVRIEVQDYGSGVPAAIRKDLFSRFVQSSPAGNGGSSRTRRSGLGLGLYIARQIAEQHGGRIGVQFNEPGTTFWVQLPVL